MTDPGADSSGITSRSPADGTVSAVNDVAFGQPLDERLKSAQARVREAENALSGAVRERDHLVRKAVEEGLSKGSVGRALGITRQAVYGLLQRTPQAHRTAREERRPNLVAMRRQAQAATSWLSVAIQQTERAESEEVDGMVDGMLAVLALYVAASCAIRALGDGHPAVQRFLGDKEVGHEPLKNSRDLLAHFDAYVAGDGNLQRAEIDGQRRPNPTDARPPLMPMWGGGPEQQLTFLTKTWVRSDDGRTLLLNGEPLREAGVPCMETLDITIDLRDSLRATGEIVGECCKGAGVADRQDVRDLLARAASSAD